MGKTEIFDVESVSIFNSIVFIVSERFRVDTKRRIDEFTLFSASWVIRARWREIQRVVRKFKTMKSIHDMQFNLVFFIFQNRRYALKGAAE